MPAAVKIELIDRLADAGLPVVEATAFVSPKWVPQMADNAEVMAGIRRKPGVAYPVLVPNRKGLDAAIAAGADEVVVFGAATESVLQTKHELHDRRRARALLGSLRRGACRAGSRCAATSRCVSAARTKARSSLQRWCASRASSTRWAATRSPSRTRSARGTPGQARAVIEAVARAHTRRAPRRAFPRHLRPGARQYLCRARDAASPTFDSSVAGLGGCPYAKGATGNVATEDVLYMLNGLGIETGVDMGKLIAAGDFICAQLGRPTQSRVARALALRARPA